MGKKKLDWGSLPFGYMKTTKSFVANWKNGEWDEGKLTKDHNVKINECAGVLQYAQTCFEGLKAYTTEHGDIVTFRPDLNAERMENSCKRLEMPVFPKERFIEAVLKTIKPYDRFQFMRMGYYSAVKTYGKDGKYEFNQITGLKDSYGK